MSIIQKDLYDIVFLYDHEIGIDSDRENARPCLIVGLDAKDGGGYIVPLTSQWKPDDPNRMQYRLEQAGSIIDLSKPVVKVSQSMIDYAELSDKYVTQEDAEVLDERYEKYIEESYK